MNKTPRVEAALGHAYDGIQEYDNPLPGWWTWIFIGTIVFSVFYFLYFHSGAPNRTMIDSLEASQRALTLKQYGAIGDLKQDRETLVRFVQDKDWVLYGKSIYRTNCVSCHGPEGGGLAGPNLTDNTWKNVKHIEDIMTIINNGAGGNAMPAWKQRFTEPRDVIMVSAFVASLQGINVAGGKGPEGNNVIPNWDEDIASVPKYVKPADAPGDKKATEEKK